MVGEISEIVLGYENIRVKKPSAVQNRKHSEFPGEAFYETFKLLSISWKTSFSPYRIPVLILHSALIEVEVNHPKSQKAIA